MLRIGYAKSVPDEGARHNETHHPLTRPRFAQAPSPTRGEGKKERRYFPFAILRQCCHAASIRFSLASGVRNAECAESVTLGSLVKR